MSTSATILTRRRVSMELEGHWSHMIYRIPQRGQDDCAICTVAMVMGPPYSYERVQLDSRKYPHITAEAKYSAWWETYLRDENFSAVYCRTDGLSALWQYRGQVVGILGMDIPHLKRGHLVAVDEAGVVDPATGTPAHVLLQHYMRTRLSDGMRFHDGWLAVRRPEARQSTIPG